jgi:hypothetical protein
LNLYLKSEEYEKAKREARMKALELEGKTEEDLQKMEELELKTLKESIRNLVAKFVAHTFTLIFSLP